MNDRRLTLGAGAALLLFSLAVVVESATFRVNFPTDPLGPAAFPLFAAGLIALGAVALLWGGVREGAGERPGAPGDEPAPSDEPEPSEGATSGGRRIVLASLTFIGYALLLPVLGFVLATTVAFALLALLFGGDARTGIVVGLAFSVALFAVFVWGLGLPLPVWPWPVGG